MTNYHIPLQLAVKLEGKISHKEQIEKLAKSFVYDDSQPLSTNLKLLGNKIVTYLQLSGSVEGTLREYLVEKNIPIEVNFKPLRGEQLKNIIDEWLSFHSETSTIVEKLYTNNHRNILFKRVLFEQKESINDYFQTLSQKNMLKAVDLYQLLVDILSNYFLYEYNVDSETFFDKINSFNSFVDIVQKFVNSAKRISLGTTHQDFSYVRRIQFERLIQFWQQENSELTLLSDKRINKIEVESQTTLLNMNNQGSQTQKSQICLKQFINNSLNTLNNITASTQNSNQLILIENLYSFLRKTKIALHDGPQNNSNRTGYGGELKIDIESELTSNCFPSPHPSQPVYNHSKPQQFLELIDRSDLDFQVSRTHSPPKNVKDVLERIYNYYKEFSGFTTQTLEKCFMDIGIIDHKNDPLTLRVLSRKNIANRFDITIQQFKTIFQYLMKIDKELTLQVLQEFIKSKNNLLRVGIPGSTSHVDYSDLRRDRKASIYTSRNYYGKYLNSTMYY